MKTDNNNPKYLYICQIEFQNRITHYLQEFYLTREPVKINK
jgi:hypothetical protein